MCNRLHDNSTPVPKYGVAYKIVMTFLPDSKPGRKKKLYSPYYEVPYKILPSGWINWTNFDYIYTDWTRRKEGFCFFADPCEALWTAKNMLTIRNFQTYHVWKVQYDEGLGCHIEHLMSYDPPFILIARAFRFLHEIYPDDPSTWYPRENWLVQRPWKHNT